MLHVFTSLLGGAPLCIPYRLYNGTPLGGTTRGTLEGCPGRVLSGGGGGGGLCDNLYNKLWFWCFSAESGHGFRFHKVEPMLGEWAAH